jgi:hypothetical protein
MSASVFILGAPFIAIFHHDGRFIRAPGLFAFARHDGRRHTILHLELAEAINRRAGPTHARWCWALGQGLNELLVCLASAPASVIEEGATQPVVWHTGAQVWFDREPNTGGAGADLDLQTILRARGAR